MRSASGDSCSSTERRGPERRHRPRGRGWSGGRVPGPRSVPPVHESRPRYQRHSLRSELPRQTSASFSNWLSGGGSSCACLPSSWTRFPGYLDVSSTGPRSARPRLSGALGDASTVVEPRRLPDVIEGGHADKPHPGVCCGGIRRLPCDWRPAASLAP